MHRKLLMTPLLIGGLVAGPALAADNTPNLNTTGRNAANVGTSNQQGERKDAASQVNEATKVVQKMKQDPQMKKILSQAKGIFVVPDYGRGAIVVGASGGEGVMLAKQGGSWTNPLFYDMGAISVGAQVGGSAGQIALVLMNDRAVEAFKQDNKFSLDAKAGISIVNYSARGEGNWGRGDIVLWSDTEGAYAGASIAVSDINFDEGETKAYYGRELQPSAAIGGTSHEEAPQSAQQLKQALSG
jgi:lipid-binding SYLF domain-containing protein